VTSAPDLLIVGAGVAGLRAAQVAAEAGLSVVIIEADDAPGGRIQSHVVDGFILDDGFQLINPSYPELKASGVLPVLDLRSFDPAVRYVSDTSSYDLVDPRWRPLQALGALRHPQMSLKSAINVARLLGTIAFSSEDRLTRGVDCSAWDGLLAEGIAEETVAGVLQPFLRGALLDDELNSSWRFTKMLLKSFVSGRPGTPATGAGALPQALVRASGGSLVYGERATAVSATSVTTTSQTYQARAVIVALDGASAASLIGTPAPQWRRQSAYWCSLPKVDHAEQLRIDAVGGLWNTLDMSSVAPERAPVGRSLVVASAASDVVDPHITTTVARLYDVATSDVEVIERQLIERALPVAARPLDLHRPVEHDGVVVAGDYLQTPSIQGAMLSGRRAAEAALAHLSA